MKETDDMITHKAISNRFKAGESVENIAWELCRGGMSFVDDVRYVERAIRTVLRRQHARQDWRTK